MKALIFILLVGLSIELDASAKLFLGFKELNSTSENTNKDSGTIDRLDKLESSLKQIELEMSSNYDRLNKRMGLAEGEMMEITGSLSSLTSRFNENLKIFTTKAEPKVEEKKSPSELGSHVNAQYKISASESQQPQQQYGAPPQFTPQSAQPAQMQNMQQFPQQQQQQQGSQYQMQMRQNPTYQVPIQNQQVSYRENMPFNPSDITQQYLQGSGNNYQFGQGNPIMGNPGNYQINGGSSQNPLQSFGSMQNYQRSPMNFQQSPPQEYTIPHDYQLKTFGIETPSTQSSVKPVQYYANPIGNRKPRHFFVDGDKPVITTADF